MTPGAVESSRTLASASGVGVPNNRPSWGLTRGDELGADRYVLGFLGEGRKSEVYLAWDRRRRSTVAAKLLLRGRPGKLGKELGLLQRLSHPLIVRGFDAVLEGSRPHLAMEHVHGPSLRRLLRKGPLPPALVASVGLQTASVLHYLAMQDMVHIDVKPQNILLTRPS